MTEYADVIILLALLQYMYFIMQVGTARGKTGVKAPSCSGNQEFEKRFRIQQNTLEQLIIFVPAMFLFSYYLDPFWAAAIGVIYIIGRFIYANAYFKDPKGRGLGMMMSFIPNVVLTIGGITGAVMSLL